MKLVDRTCSSYIAQSIDDSSAVCRRYVFDDYTWDMDGPEYSKFGDKYIPSRIPLTALISGMPSGLFPSSRSFVDGRCRPDRWWAVRRG